MSRLRLFNFIRPGKLLHGIRERGAAGAVLHGVRRAGAFSNRALVGPYLLRINPMGYVCNHACPMCWLQHLDPAELKEEKKRDRREGMRLDDYARLLDAMPLGFEEVNIVGGGEPLIHPDITGIMREVKRRGKRGFLITNGTLLKEDIAREMVEMGWDVTRASVHAGDEQTHNQIHGVKAKFETLRRNLQTFIRLRREAGAGRQCQLLILNVLQRENIGQIDRLFAFAEDVGADRIVFEKVIPYHDGMILNAAELRRAVEQLTQCAARSSVPCNLDEIVPQLRVEQARAEDGRPWAPARRCSVGFDQAFITADGEVRPCCFSDESMGNLREQSFDEIWKGKAYKDFRDRLINGRFADYCIINRCTMKGVLHH